MSPDDPDDRDPPEESDRSPGPREPDEVEPDDVEPDDVEPSDDAPPESPRSELRAKDLVTRSREELEEELDPATMAELASWFVRPSMTEARAREVPEEVTRGSAPAAELDAFEKLGAALGFEQVDDAVRNRALAAIEPRMLDLLDRHARAADAILPVRVEPKAVIDETLLPASVRALVPVEGEELPLLGEPRLLQPSRDIEELLANDNAPQAVLRDLNRPVEEFERRLERVFAAPAPEDDVTNAVREALRWRPEAIPPRLQLPDLHGEWRPLLAGSWIELVAAGKAQRAAETAAAAEQDQRDLAAGIMWRF